MRSHLTTVFFAASAAIMGAACGGRQADSMAPGVTGDRLGAGTISGTWAHTAIGPVYRESMTLTQAGTHVTGTGNYAIEAGRTGPTTIAGDWAGKTLTLTITRDYGLVETFVGTMSDASHLGGTLTIEGFEQPFAFARQ